MDDFDIEAGQARGRPGGIDCGLLNGVLWV
jgi:hypothetical protein